MLCDACQRELPEPKVLGPTLCPCGHWISPDWPVHNCVHLDDTERIKMECKCGVAYRCKLLKKLCSPSKPVDEFVFAGDVQLNADNFQWCGDCPSMCAKSGYSARINNQRIK